MAIYEAIGQLPETLVTEEIVKAAVEEGDIRLLSVLPARFASEELVNALLEKNMDSYHKFNLDNIPENCRSEAVYLKAVKDSGANFLRVPDAMKNKAMLEELLKSFTSNLYMVRDIPVSLWDKESVYRAVKSLYGYTVSNYSRNYRGYGSSSKDSDNILKVQIFLHHIPAVLKDAGFYQGLFEKTSLTVEDIDLITPKRFKKEDYYKRLAGKDVSFIPESMYTYDMLMLILRENERAAPSSLFDRESLKEKFIELMDDAMADAFIRKDPWFFSHLPDVFKTEERILTAISLMESRYYNNKIIPEEAVGLLTDSVCRALVKKGFGYPKLPGNIWTQDFVDYCMEHSPNDDWFEQMPSEFQSIEITEKMLEYSFYNARLIKPELISEKRAKELFRDKGYSNYKQYVPKHYLSAFEQLTGLPEDFFGGEVPFLDVKEKREDYTYCKMGDFYIGFYNRGSSWGPDYRLTVTRRNPMKFTPEAVFDHCTGTFHQTWAEKMLADSGLCDKPAVSKELKQYQYNCYCNLKKAGSIDGVDIYENTLLGGNLCYAAGINGTICFDKNKDELLEKINEYKTAC